MIKCKFSSSWRQIFEKIRRVKFLRIVISYDCVVIEGYRTRTGLLLFAFSPPLLFRFSYLFFPPLTGHLVGFILVGNVLGKTFRILGLNERKGRWVVEQDFHGNFRGNVTWFFAFNLLVSLTELCSFWYGLKDLFLLHKLADKFILDF